jgi:hypothetical protein
MNQDFIRRSAESCIFRQSWWLESLSCSGVQGDVVVQDDKHHSVVLPYIIQKKYGFRILTMPPLTQTLGPLIQGVDYQDNRKLASEKDLYNSLVDKLPSYDVFNQNFHWSVTNWLPFYWKGFEQSTRYTYRLNDISDTDLLWKNLRPNIKSDIKKAEKRFELRVHSDHSVDRFLDINEMTFKRQGQKLPYSRGIVRNLDEACSLRNCRKIFYAEDKLGRIHAAIYLVWDNCSAYYLMGGGDPELRNSGATSLAMWEAIKFASTVTQSFDFEGSMLEPVERFFRGFGATQVPYFHVWHFKNQLLKTAWHAKSLFS